MHRPKSTTTGRGRSRTPGARGGEFAAIAAIEGSLPGPPAGEVWIGDDAAVLAPVPGRLLLTTDLSVAGVHADLDVMDLEAMGWRAVAAAVSDVAAMGGRAQRVVVAVAGPPGTDLPLLYRGVGACAAEHGCPVVGGDLSGCPVLVVAVTVTGQVEGEPGPVLRRGARPGDRILVTGPVGAAAAGLRVLRRHRTTGRGGAGRGGGGPGGARGEQGLIDAHLRPRARLAEGEAARAAGVTAMIDVSDGLLADLGHVADASHVGFRVEGVPVAAGAGREEALGGGEDYELIMVTPDPDRLTEGFARAGLRPPVLIGRCTADEGDRTVDGGPAARAGWEHPFEVRS